MVDPVKMNILLYTFEEVKGENNISDHETYRVGDIIKSKVFDGLEIPLEELFTE